MIVHRISHPQFIEDLTGYGAWLKGGRWNSPGRSVLYTSSSLPLAAWEVFVNLPKEFLPAKPLSSATIFIPDKALIQVVPVKSLNVKWFDVPHPKELREIGDQWLDKKESLVLKVPSSVIRGEYNFLLNPNHPAFKTVKVQSILPFKFDPRIFK